MRRVSVEEEETWTRENCFAGIDVGSVSLNGVVIDAEPGRCVYEAPYQRHLGKVDERVLALIEDIYAVRSAK
jgi:activator of 2-hydroxyglutaryl-CoA dehydratase